MSKIKMFFLSLSFLPLFFALSISNLPNAVAHGDQQQQEKASEDCSGCNAYKCMDERDAHCGGKGYLIGYGEANCERFSSKEIYDQFNQIGKRFINCTRNCLIYYMEHYILDHKSAGIDCGELKHAGFASHSVCYMDCDFCAVCKTNKLALLRAYRLRDFFSLDAIQQVFTVMRRCGMFNCLFGKNADESGQIEHEIGPKIGLNSVSRIIQRNKRKQLVSRRRRTTNRQIGGT